jgi:hypothetical protein
MLYINEHYIPSNTVKNFNYNTQGELTNCSNELPFKSMKG